MVAEEFGPETHDATMRRICADASQSKAPREECPGLQMYRKMLRALKFFNKEDQDKFLLEASEGRFGIDWQRYV